MATYGWQNEQVWYTYSSHIRLIGNIRVDGITHSGTDLRVWGAIKGGARGDSNYRFYFSDYTSYAQPEGGDKIALGAKGRTWRVGDDDVIVGFDVTLRNVPAGSTSRQFFVNYYGPNTNAVNATLRWTLNFDASITPPQGPYINFISSTYKSVLATSGVTSWGGATPHNLQGIMCIGSSHADFNSILPSNWTTKGRYVWKVDTSSLSTNINMVAGEEWNSYNNPMPLKGMIRYYLACWQESSAGTNSTIIQTLRYLPPAPCLMTYTEASAGGGAKNYTFTFLGDVDANYADYTQSELYRTVRYKINNASTWTYAENNVNKAVGATTVFTANVPAGGNVQVEGWMNYRGLESEHKTMTVYNGSAPSSAYGSVDGKSKLIQKFYGSVDGQSVEIVKLYGSVDGKAKTIYG